MDRIQAEGKKWNRHFLIQKEKQQPGLKTSGGESLLQEVLTGIAFQSIPIYWADIKTAVLKTLLSDARKAVR